jgi:prevent-host-death family protein
MQVNIHEAKTNFSRLVDRALAGEEITIAKNGHPLLRLVPIREAKQKRIPGLSEGKGQIVDDFDAPLDSSILDQFEK